VTVDEYFDALQQRLKTHSLVLQQNLVFRNSGVDTGYVEGYLLLPESHRLYIAEYINAAPAFTRRKYRFHLQDAAHHLVRRWDDAPHHPHLPTFPHHCHLPDGSVIAAPPMDLFVVLVAIQELFQ
jgi:hypothetical protein